MLLVGSELLNYVRNYYLIITIKLKNYFSLINNVFRRPGKCANAISSRDDSGGRDRGERTT